MGGRATIPSVSRAFRTAEILHVFRFFNVLLASTIMLAACDGHKSGGSGAATAQDQVLAEFPGLLPSPDTVWLDVPLSGACWTDSNLMPGAFYYKPDTAAFPRAEPAELLIDRNRQPKFEDPVGKDFKVGVFQDLANPQTPYVAWQDFFNNITGLTSHCIRVDPSRLGQDFLSDKDEQGRDVRVLMRVGTLSLDRTEQISSFQALRPGGYTSESRKYRILADLKENPRFGARSYKLERDVLVYFDAPDNVWKLDPSSSTNWLVTQ